MVGGAPAFGAPLPSVAQEDSVSPSCQAKFLFYLTLLSQKGPLIIPSYTHIHTYSISYLCYKLRRAIHALSAMTTDKSANCSRGI